MTLIAATMVHTKEKTPFDILYKTSLFFVHDFWRRFEKNLI